MESNNRDKAPKTSPEEISRRLASPPREAPDFLPARMLNEYAYCPRLGYLMWVQGEFADNVYTEDGRFRHRRVDQESGEMPAADEDDPAPRVVRSVLLSSSRDQLIARIDLVELEAGRAIPVDYKRGSKPAVPEGAYEPERVQLSAQGMILRENGFTCDHGVLYFAASKERVARFCALPFQRLDLASDLADVLHLGESGHQPVGDLVLHHDDAFESQSGFGCFLYGLLTGGYSGYAHRHLSATVPSAGLCGPL